MLVFVARAIDPQFYTVFKANDGKYPCYRQVRIIYVGFTVSIYFILKPAIVTTNTERTHLLVFAEGRIVSSCAPPLENGMETGDVPNENGGLEMRRSLDGGSTWLPQKTLYSGNIDFYTVVWDSTSNTIYLMLEAPGGILVFTSRDEVSYLKIYEMYQGRTYFYLGSNMVRSSTFTCASSSIHEQSNQTCCWSWY
jgi:hypothetical protein